MTDIAPVIARIIAIQASLEGVRLINAIRRSWTSTESLNSTRTLLFKPLSFRPV